METFSALLAISAGNSPVPGEFPAQRPVTRSFDVFFDLHPNKRLSKQWWGWWFDTLSCPLWRHHNEHDYLFAWMHLIICDFGILSSRSYHMFFILYLIKLALGNWILAIYNINTYEKKVWNVWLQWIINQHLIKVIFCSIHHKPDMWATDRNKYFMRRFDNLFP